MKTSTKIISGHAITLVVGRRYRAYLTPWPNPPIARRINAMVEDNDPATAATSEQEIGYTVVLILELTPEQGDEFIATFMDGATPEEGRLWT